MWVGCAWSLFGSVIEVYSMTAALMISFVICQASLWVIYHCRYDDLPEWLAKTLLAVFVISIFSFLFMAMTEIGNMQYVGTSGAARDTTESNDSGDYIGGRVFYPAVARQ